MSKDIRDLYKKKGENLSKDIIESKEKIKIRLKENLSGFKNINPEMKKKLLQLQYKHKLDSQNNKIQLKIESNNKDKILTIMLSFGTNYQRVEGKKITDLDNFLLEFNTFYNLNLDLKIFVKNLKELQKHGLIYKYSNNELLFEPFSVSTDVNKLFRLIQDNGLLEYHKIKNSNPDWKDEKIINLLNLLELEGILIKDNDSYWFPQFVK